MPLVSLRKIATESEAVKISKWFDPGNQAAFLTNDVRENVQPSHLLAKSQEGNLFLFCDKNDIPFGLGTLGTRGNPRNYEIAVITGDKNLWETGKGALGASLLIDYLFLTLNAHKVFAMTLAINPYAISILVAGGFKFEARLRDHYFVDGNFEDCIIWSQLRDEYMDIMNACHPNSVFAVSPAISPEMRKRAKKLLQNYTGENI